MTPRDVGNGVVNASLGGGGEWLSLAAPHARHGYVELTALPPFEPAWRGDVDAVRRYRGWMNEERFWWLRVEGGEEVETWAPAGEARLCARWRLAGGGAFVRVRGRVDAHPLPEITEVAPPAPTGAVTRLRTEGKVLVLEARVLPARAEVRVAGAGAWEITGDEAQCAIEGGEVVVTCTIHWPPCQPPGRGGRRNTGHSGKTASTPEGGSVRAALAAQPAPPREPAAAAASLLVPPHLRAPLAALADAARAYVLDCTAVAVGPHEVCLLTDHRILPLSWTRDAYHQAALLLAGGGCGIDVVGDHLRWLWGRCERPGGLWMRSHHATGAVKDPVFQADQQLYPLLELCDYRDATGELPRPPGGGDRERWWRVQVDELWAALPVDDGLVPTDENPADDRAALPYALSSQILRWQAAARLGLASDPVRGRFTVDGPFGRQWAYEIDGRGAHRFYHDANDLPTALAPLVGFCAPCDPTWCTTMRFAFSHHNAAYRPGAYGGLGSLHTPGTWTLGDVQEWVVASVLGDAPRATRALERLLAVAGDGGLLPEAYDARTGRAPIRRWFAWPGASLGWLLLRHA